MSRVDAARFGAMKAALPLAGTVAGLGCFLSLSGWSGKPLQTQVATAIIQPGGSVRDAGGDCRSGSFGIAMAFTGIRHFRHG